MNKSLYRKLARNNIRKNKNTFLPFTISNTTMITMFFMLLSIKNQASMANFYGGNILQIMLSLGTWICGLFAIGVIYYTNGFLMKRRKKELGLYSILGLEKKHIGKVLFWEITYVGGLSILLSVTIGLLFSKLMFLFLLNLLQLNSTLKFFVSWKAVGTTILIFAGVFLVTILYNNIHLIFLKPIEILRGGTEGEKEPKAKWLLAVCGILCLGTGYYIALTTENALAAINLFFVAVLFVMAGTFLLFMSGSIAFLKILKKNKKYYYHKTHFITVSGLIYRMKQNAIGLSNICILSTAVLVVLSSTLCLYLGLEDIMRTMYPSDVTTQYLYTPEQDALEGMNYTYDNELIAETFLAHGKEHQVQVTDTKGYYNVYAIGTVIDNYFITDDFENADLSVINIVTLDDFIKNGYLKEGEAELEKGQILLYQENAAINETETFTIKEMGFTIVEDHLSDMAWEDVDKDPYVTTMMVVSDFDVLQEICKNLNVLNQEQGRESVYEVVYNYQCNLVGTLENKTAFCSSLRDAINAANIPHVSAVGNIFTTRAEIIGIYGSLLFIGIFIGTMFLMTTVLIIYYKQISEGYDDRERFQIMQNVGMSKKEVQTVIKNQVLTIFFLPILLAVVHIAFAFEIIRKILAVMSLTNVSLFIGCTLGTIGVFLIIYGIVYILTARTYYKIVEM